MENDLGGGSYEGVDGMGHNRWMMRMLRSFGNDSDIVLETASVSGGESDVSDFSPGGSPGVLDLPVAS
jgi:hypothetical protein